MKVHAIIAIILVLVTTTLYFASCSKKSEQDSATYIREIPKLSEAEREAALKKYHEMAEKAEPVTLLGEKSCPDSVGDIVFADGSATAYSLSVTLTDKQKDNAIAVIFYTGTECSNDGRERILGVGLSIKRDVIWSSDENIGYKEIKSLECAINGEEGNYSFTGNLDGSKNFQAVKDYLISNNFEDRTDEIESLSNGDSPFYPSFYFVNHYASEKNSRVNGSPFAQGWYIPSIAELFQFWKARETFNAASKLCGGDCLTSKDYVFYSSSLLPYSRENEYTAPYTLYFSKGSYDYEKYIQLTSACAIYDFTEIPQQTVTTLSFLNSRDNFYKDGKRLKGMYVNSKEGLTVREEPTQGAKRRCGLKHGEYVILEEFGKTDTIDGITAPWVKIILDTAEWKSREPEYGWVFSGYLEKTPTLSSDEILSLISETEPYKADFFISDFINDYMTKENEWQWERVYQGYDFVMPNYCCNDFERKNAVTIQDCPFLLLPETYGSYNYLMKIKAGTKIKLEEVVAYGGGLTDFTVLYPIYRASAFIDESTVAWGLIRGLDITEEGNISSVSDGNGGNMSLYCQQALHTYNAPNGGKDGWQNPQKEDIEKYLNNWFTYEIAGLKGGYSMIKAGVIDSKGKKYDIAIQTDGWLRLLYPLNMEKPVPFVNEIQFHGGQGGGASKHIIYTMQLYDSGAQLEKVLEYEFCDTDGGPTGTGSFYFTKNGICTYVYEKDYDTVTQNDWISYKQSKGNPYEFSYEWTKHGEPKGKSHVLKEGDYANPVCNLKMHFSPSTSSENLYTLGTGTLVKVLEVGNEASIGGIKSNWVRVQMVNDDSFVEGYRSENETTGWVFAGYLD